MKKARMKLAKNIVAVVTALSLVFLQTPLVYAQPDAADEPDVAAAAVEEAPAADEPVASVTPADEPAVDDPAEPGSDEPGEASDEGADASESAGDDESASSSEGEESTVSSEGAGDSESASSTEGDESSSSSEAGDEAVSESESSSEGESSSSSAAQDKAKKQTKRVYTYSDSSIKVKATLDKASAIPDDATLKVTAVTPSTAGYNYDAYLDALNKGQSGESAYTQDNTLLYDVAFIWTDKAGKVVELEPESGSVKLEFSFRNQQITDDLGVNADEGDTLEVKHLPLAGNIVKKAGTTKNATDITASDVIVEDPISASNSGDTVSMRLNSLSVVSLRAQANGEERIINRIELYGAKMAHWYGGSPSVATDVINMRNIDASLPFGFESGMAFADSASWYVENGFIGAEVENPYTANTWVCVGFIISDDNESYTKVSSSNPDDLRDYLCSWSNKDEAVAFVESFGDKGVLYGEVPTEAFYEQATKGKRTILGTVWYEEQVTKVNRFSYNEAEEMITGAVPVAYEPTNSGIEVTYESSMDVIDGHGIATINYIYRIPQDFNDDTITIDPSDIKGIVVSGLEPGDDTEYRITVIDETGGKYEMIEGSGAVGTVNDYGPDCVARGFEDYGIPDIGQQEEHDGHKFAVGGRRSMNNAIKDLYKMAGYPQYYGGMIYDWAVNTAPTDDLVGIALYKLGYGEGSDDLDERARDITWRTFTSDEAMAPYAKYAQYLDDYYLDWINKKEGATDSPAYTSFKDVPRKYLVSFFQAPNNTQVSEANSTSETNAVIANMMYYTFYEHIYRVSDTPNASDPMGFYTLMGEDKVNWNADGSYLGNAFSTYLESQWADVKTPEQAGVETQNENAKIHKLSFFASVDGFAAGNADQNTAFFASCQIKLKKKPTAEKFYFGEGTPEFTFSVYPCDEECTITGDVKATGAVAVDESGHGYIDFKQLDGQTCDFDEPGTYLVKEDSKDGYVTDDACYRLTVAQGEDGKLTRTYTLFHPNSKGELENLGDLGKDEVMTFYNNGRVTIEDEHGKPGLETDDQVMVYPHAKKYLDDNAAIETGRFLFKLAYKSGDADKLNKLPRTGYNDENGDVAFYDEKTEQGLVFTEPGTYRYSITEVADASDETVNYDPTEIVMVVKVTEEDDVLKASVVYTGPKADVAQFNNTTVTGTSVKVHKVSSAGGDGLADCVYGLWMRGPSGDAMLAQGISDAEGWITFENVNLSGDRLYYFKEVAAPDGYLLDPYRTACFSVEENEDGSRKLVVAEETAEDGWHAASYED